MPFFAMLSAPALAATLTVGTDADSLDQAVQQAQPGDIIMVPAGTWLACVSSDKDVTIKGAGHSRTTLSGQGQCADAIQQAGGSLTLSGVTLTNPGGRAIRTENGDLFVKDVLITGSGDSHLLGGGLTAVNSNVFITGGEITNNTARQGGGMHLESSQLIAARVTIKANRAQSGGGLSAQGSSQLTLSICQLQDNVADVSGGGLYATGDVQVEDTGSVFSANASTGSGGGIVVERGGGLRLMETRFEGNRASSGSGGGVFVEAIDALTIADAQFTRNQSDSSGGAISLSRIRRPAEITGSSFSDNSAGRQGGALMATEGAVVNITNTRFTNNTADEAGAISLRNNSSRIISAELTGNTSTAGGGGLSAVSTGTHTLSIEASQLLSNRAARAGGGVHASGLASLRLVDTTLTENAAASDDGTTPRLGGGLYIHRVGNVMITGSRLCTNTADDGGSLYLDAVDNIVVKESAFAANAPGLRGDRDDARQSGVSSAGNISWLNNTDGCD